MNDGRPYVLSIAGFDPSGGAGILADIKTFEMHKTTGLGICTAITFQNDTEFFGVNWLSLNEIKMQIDALFVRFSIDWVKIGLIQDFMVLKDVVLYLKKLNPAVKIIWDPILTASAGFVFHKEVNQKVLRPLMKNLFLITPNKDEVLKLVPDVNEEMAALKLNCFCNVLLKGGHSNRGKAVDILYEKVEKTNFEGKMMQENKHGTGCVLSAAILANLAVGKTLKQSCKEGKNYINDFILSHKGLLGYHHV